MITEEHPLQPLAPGVNVSLAVHRFGTRGARPHVHLQTSLHADEIPGMITCHHLRARLLALEAEGRIAGEISLIAVANPIGLAQRILGQPVGRFDLSDGVNFNRSYPNVISKVAERIDGSLSSDATTNIVTVREALRSELAASDAMGASAVLKKLLLQLAADADIVLDLHCDSEAVVHLYTHPRSREEFSPLAALLGARALLLAEISGDDPFDEACSRPWAELTEQFADFPIPFGCHSATVELRGETDVTHEFAAKDAAALVDFMILRGAIGGAAPEMPMPLCSATPLAGSEPVNCPASGIIVFKAAPGDRLQSGDVVAEIIDPITGVQTQACATTDGVMFARAKVRFASKGQPIAKVAGTTARRTGKLLTA